MEYYKKFRKLREHLVLMPGLKSYKDFDIAVEIGHYEHLGQPLTLKQLLLLDIASEATVRRHLAKLVNDGLVQKSPNPNDSRSVVFTLTDKAHRLFKQCMDDLVVLFQEII